ncbi:MAG: pilus assembly protein PilW [Gammaproteobacteria bacterium]|nr:pilus assembly protein PilW [Gammaproteobacteria bacterium]
MNRTTTQRARQRGITLVELMVALTVSLILLAGVLQIFQANRQSYRVQEGLSRMQENGRFAIEFLAHDIRMADFWGCANGIGKITNNLNSGAASGFIDFGTGGIDGTEGGGLNGSDSLVLRGGFGTGISLDPPFGPQASATLQAPGNDLQQGDIVLVSDCSAGDIFQVSNANPQNASGSIVHNTGSGTPGNSNVSNPGCPGSNAHCLSKVYGADATLFKAREITYSIQVGASGEPALFRTIASGTSSGTQELVDGIEELQVRYGEDSDGDGSANYYVNANNVNDMQDVVSIRLAVVARSYTDNLTGGTAQKYTIFGNSNTPGDNRLRQVYTATIGVRNRLP